MKRKKFNRMQNLREFPRKLLSKTPAVIKLLNINLIHFSNFAPEMAQTCFPLNE